MKKYFMIFPLLFIILGCSQKSEPQIEKTETVTEKKDVNSTKNIPLTKKVKLLVKRKIEVMPLQKMRSLPDHIKNSHIKSVLRD